MNTHIHTHERTQRMNEHTYTYSKLRIAVTQYKIQTQQNTTIVQSPPYLTLWQKVETKLSYSGIAFCITSSIPDEWLTLSFYMF